MKKVKKKKPNKKRSNLQQKQSQTVTINMPGLRPSLRAPKRRRKTTVTPLAPPQIVYKVTPQPDNEMARVANRLIDTVNRHESTLIAARNAAGTPTPALVTPNLSEINSFASPPASPSQQQEVASVDTPVSNVVVSQSTEPRTPSASVRSQSPTRTSEAKATLEMRAKRILVTNLGPDIVKKPNGIPLVGDNSIAYKEALNQFILDEKAEGLKRYMKLAHQLESGSVGRKVVESLFGKKEATPLMTTNYPVRKRPSTTPARLAISK